MALDTSETLFTVLTAINTCGYDQELGVSDPLRSRVRSEVARARANSQPAKDATVAMCKYYDEHAQPEASKALSQYISLALFLNPAPNLTAKVKEADMPPDATAVLGILPLMQKFYETTGLHGIWEGDYLHYLLDPLAMKYPGAMKRIEPLLESVKTAPMDQSFKSDVSLLVTECFIRAIEARTTGSAKAPDAERVQAVENSTQQGFVLTPYFYEALVKFEKDPAGLRNAYGDLVSNIDVGKERKRASQVTFATNSDPELLHLSRPLEGKLLVAAEKRLSAGDTESAQKLAQQALEEKNEDPGRALFILAEVATHNSDMQGARNYFERALEVAHEPKVVAWSHIFLGRIFDLQEDRPAALDHYRAAENAGSGLPEAKAAAELGLRQPYEPHRDPK